MRATLPVSAQPTLWQQFINPPKIHRGSTGLTLEARQAGAAVGGITLATPTSVIANTAVSVLRAPSAVAQAYKTLWQTRQVGPNVKTLGSVVIPPIAALAVMASPIAAAGWGVFRGVQGGLEYGVTGAVRKTLGDATELWKRGSWEMLDEMTDDLRRKPLKAGEEPFDISLWRSAVGLVSGVISAALAAPLLGAMTLARVPQAALKILVESLKSFPKHPFMTPVATLAVSAAVPVAVGLSPFAGAILGLGRGTYLGYTKGFVPALDEVFSSAKEFWKSSGRFLEV